MTQVSTPQSRILIATDAPQQEFYQHELQSADYELRFISDFRQGVEAFTLNNPDILLIDTIMTPDDGLKICQSIRAIHAEAPIIMITPNDDARVAAAFDAGSDDCLIAPVMPALLLKRIERLLFKQYIAAQLQESQVWSRHIFEQNRSSILIFDPITQMIVEANPAACEFYGYTLDQLKQKRIADIAIHQQAEIDENVTRIMEGQQSVYYFQHRLASGEIRTVEVHASPIIIEGRPLLFTNILDITERQLNEERLRQSEARFRQIYENAPVMMHSVDESNRQIIDVNRKWLEETGYTREEIIGRTPTDFLTPESARRAREEYVPRFWQDGLIRDVPYQFVRKDGRIMDVVMDSNAAKAPDGKRISLTVIRDVTAQKATQEALRSSESEMRSIFGAMADLVMVVNHEGRYVKIAPTNQSLLYSAATNLLGRTFSDVLPPKQATEFYAYVQTVLTKREPLQVEYDLTINSQRHWFNATISPMEGDQQVVWVAQDVTAIKKAGVALRESEQRYRSLFESANDIILIIDMNTGRILDANKKAAKKLGYSRDELRVMSIEDIEESANTSDTERISYRSDTTGKRLIFEQNYRHKNGATVPVETSNRIIQSGGERLIFSFARDISERKAAQKAQHREKVLTEALQSSAEVLNKTLELNQVLDLMLDTIANVFPYDTASIMLLENKTASVSSHRGFEKFGITAVDVAKIQFHIDNTPNLRSMYRYRRPYLISDTSKNPDWHDVTQKHWINCYLGAPIILDNEVIGFINLDHHQVNGFNQGDADRLQAFAIQTAAAIRNARLFTQVQRYASELEDRVISRTQALSKANQELKQQIIIRERIEVELHEERNLLKTLVNNLPDNIYIKDTQGRFVMVNRVTPTAQIGKTDLELMKDKGKAEQIFETEQKIIRGELSAMTYEDMFTDDTGNIRWIDVTKVPLRDTQGVITGLIGMNHDITALKHAEDQLRHIISGARCLLWIAIAERKQHEYKWDIYIPDEEAAQAFLPVKTDSLSTYAQAWLASRHPDDVSLMQGLDNQALDNSLSSYSMEYRCYQTDGKLRWLHEDIQIKPLTSGRWSLVGVCTDITALKEAEETLREANDELERRVAIRTAELSEANKVLQQEINDRKRAEQAERDQRILAEALRDAAAAVNQTLELDEVLSIIVNYIHRVVPTHNSTTVMLIEGHTDGLYSHLHFYRSYVNKQWIVTPEAERGPSQIKMDSLWVYQHMYTTGQSVLVRDTGTHPHWVQFEQTAWIKSFIGIPIQSEGKPIGFINLSSGETETFNEEHARRVQAFANQAGVAIQNARLVGEIRRYTSELEDMVVERTDQLDRERAQLNAILNAMLDGVIYRDAKYEPLYVNRALVEMAGYTAEEWLSRGAERQINTISPQDIQAITQQTETILEKQTFFQNESRFNRKDGSQFDALVTRTNVKDAEGNRIGIVSVIRDISQEKELQEQKSRFIANAAHELRTPTANLKTRLYLMRRQPEKLQEHLGVGEEVIKWMQMLIENLFDMSRFERGLIALEKEPMILQEVVMAVIRFQQPDAENKNIALHWNLPDQPTEISGDRTRLMQVFSNLLSNAINYTPPDGTIRVEMRSDYNAMTEQRLVIIDVIDTGRGIEPEHLPYVFQPFYRATDDNKGAGLGLAISREIVALHGGDMRLESETGQGSTFTVQLPLA